MHIRRGAIATIVHSQEILRTEDQAAVGRLPRRTPRQIAAYAFVPNRGGTVAVIDTTTGSPVAETVAVPTKPVGVGITPNSQFAYVANADSNTVVQIELATRTLGRQPVPVGTEPSAVGIGPLIIVAGDPSSPPLTIASDEELDVLGFGRFLPFNGGALRLMADWSTTRHVSLLAEGGWVDTNGFDASIYGDVLNDGSLTKIGLGTLALYGRNVHRRDTFVLEGTLMVDDEHDAPIYVDGGTLRGSGQLGRSGRRPA